MLQKEGTDRIFPYTEILAKEPGFIVIAVSPKQIETVLGQKATQQGDEVPVIPESSKKPGPGWIQNKQGRWHRKSKQGKK